MQLRRWASPKHLPMWAFKMKPADRRCSSFQEKKKVALRGCPMFRRSSAATSKPNRFESIRHNPRGASARPLGCTEPRPHFFWLNSGRPKRGTGGWQNMATVGTVAKSQGFVGVGFRPSTVVPVCRVVMVTHMTVALKGKGKHLSKHGSAQTPNLVFRKHILYLH